MKNPFRFQVIELEDHLVRHPVYDKLRKKSVDWFFGKGGRLYSIGFGNFSVSFIFSNDSPDKVREGLIDAKDFSVQEVKEVEVAALLRDRIVRWCYTNEFWDVLMKAAKLAPTEGHERQIKIKVEKTLQALQK